MKKSLYVVEVCSNSAKPRWYLYGIGPAVEAFTTKKLANIKAKGAKLFNRSQGMHWEFRVVRYTPVIMTWS